MKTAVAPASRRPTQRVHTASFKAGRTFVIAPFVDDGIRRVRLVRERQTKGMLRGEQAWAETQVFLDGTRLESFYGGLTTTHSRSLMSPKDAISVRSKDVVDFGRLNTAVQTLVSQMQAAPDPSPEQQETFIRGYQNVVEWMSQAQAAMDKANGEVETLGLVLRKTLGQL